MVEKRKEPPLDDPVSESNLPQIGSKRKKSSSVDAGPSQANSKISVEGSEVPEIQVASKIPCILNYFCDVSPYFEELEKNIFEADEISVQNVFPTVEKIAKYRLNELPKRVQQPVLESLGNVVAAHDGDDDFVDNPSKVPARLKVSGPPKFSMEKEDFHRRDLIKGSIDLTKKDFNAKFDVLLTILTKCQEKLGIDVVSYSASPINEFLGTVGCFLETLCEGTILVSRKLFVDHSPNVVGDDDMGMAHVPCYDNERIVEDGNDNVTKNILIDIDVPMEEENKKATPQADVPYVDIITDDVISPGFIPGDNLLIVEGVDSVNEHKDAVKDESKEEEKEDKEDGNDDKEEEKHEENDKDDKDDPDKGTGKVVDKFANDGNEDDTDSSDNIADKGVDNSTKDGNDDKGVDNSSKDGNEENIHICDPITEKV
ncbi:hypothetical protein TorRG33x02_232690 [Trema orientale]|uniref:Uncharacterized protein n=1 Tax=Trema orientale TaxID=63057 RepID=A0A2P5E5W2_TREOI|nr:hypothetical protein TorRG33x02_232690 [Trema orientale]